MSQMKLCNIHIYRERDVPIYTTNAATQSKNKIAYRIKVGERNHVAAEQYVN